MLEHIDFKDESKLLIELVKKRLKHDPEEATRLTNLLQQCVQKIENTKESEDIQPQDREFMHNAIRSAESVLGLNILRMIQQKCRVNGEVFRTTFISDAIGCMQYEHLSGVPQFQIRGKTYLNDSEKVIKFLLHHLA